MSSSKVASKSLWQYLQRACSSAPESCLPAWIQHQNYWPACISSRCLTSFPVSQHHATPHNSDEQWRCGVSVGISCREQQTAHPNRVLCRHQHKATTTTSHSIRAGYPSQARPGLQPEYKPKLINQCCTQTTRNSSCIVCHGQSASQRLPRSVGAWACAKAGCNFVGPGGSSTGYHQRRDLSGPFDAAAGMVDCVVIGAGVVGLACARAMALSGCEVVVLEEEARFGQGTSSRSSEVIHAGIYYPAGSLKARVCVEGKHMLYEYCKQKDVPHKNMGKLIVATNDSQNARLESLKAAGKGNGVNDLELISKADAEGLEPALYCTAALWSPSTGIVDSHSFMEAMLGDVNQAGGILAVNTKVLGVDASRSPFKITAKDTGSGEESVLYTKMVINAAGLDAQQVAHLTTGLASSLIPPQYLAKGNYFTQRGPSPFTRLIYPLPEPGGIGVHLTLDLGGRARFGPDVEWVDTLEYSVNPRRGDVFYARIREYYPSLPDDSLEPAYCGIRPKIVGPDGGGWTDFMVQGTDIHGIKGLVNLFGIESPGITSSMAIGRHVAGLLLGRTP